MPASRPAVSLPDARAVASEVGAAARLPAEAIPASDAVGRVLAREVASPGPLPRFDASAMDGFAVRSGDTRDAASGTRTTLSVSGEARAGHGAAGPVLPGTAARISTGAPLPDGADAVLRTEDASEREGTIRPALPVPAGHDVRRAGEDVATGDVVLAVGDRARPTTVALLTGLGIRTVEVARRPSVLVVVTGDEVRAGTGAPTRDEVHDVGGVAVPALLRAAGAGRVGVAHVGDDPDATVAALRTADTDLVVTTGGLSVGRHDHVRHALTRIGARERVPRVALRPGGPAWLGTTDGPDRPRPILGLPGNPAAAMTVLILLGLPVLEAMAGATPTRPRRAVLRGDTARDRTRHRALWATLSHGDDGTVHVVPHALQQAHRLRPAAAADVLAVVPPGESPLPGGSLVEVVPLPGASVV